ncbi:MAG: MTH1187 family thiamine-binding protein [Candidatus Thiodiazotropha sp.]
MSVILEFSIFPLDRGASVSAEVSQVVDMIRHSGVTYRLTAMGTLIETSNIAEALAIVEQATGVLHDNGCRRVYAAVKIDSRPGREHGLQEKLRSIQQRIGEVNLDPSEQSEQES